MPVNLLLVVPTVVAVSSTVDNKTILPEHIVDGKLDTAWNSRTNELAGAWVAVRLPADVHVDEIRLTAGFTKVDKKLGDLFTMNPRIKRVRVSRDGKQLFERDLDVESRALQALPIDGPGGDYKIEVADFVAGSKKTWREMPISELEVWGTAPPNAKPGKAKPVVRVGSLDQQALTQAECVKALGIADTVTKFATMELSGDLAVCDVEHGEKDTATGTATIALVRHATRPVMVAKISEQPVFGYDTGMGGTSEETAVVTAIALTTNETAVLVDDTKHQTGPMMDAFTTESTLYQVRGGVVVPILTYESSATAGESGSADKCKLRDFEAIAKLPPTLIVDCTHQHFGYPGTKGDKDWEKTTAVKYRWMGTSYVK